MPPRVQILNGDIDPSDPFRARWSDDLRAICIGKLDPSVRNIGKQNPDIIRHLYDVMESDWQYVGGTVSVKKFRSHLSNVMKAQRAKLHKHFISIGKRLDKKPPENVKPEQWKSLCEWWISPEGIASITKMTYARGEVKYPSKVGRGGYRGREEDFVSVLTGP